MSVAAAGLISRVASGVRSEAETLPIARSLLEVSPMMVFSMWILLLLVPTMLKLAPYVTISILLLPVIYLKGKYPIPIFLLPEESCKAEDPIATLKLLR